MVRRRHALPKSMCWWCITGFQLTAQIWCYQGTGHCPHHTSWNSAIPGGPGMCFSLHQSAQLQCRDRSIPEDLGCLVEIDERRGLTKLWNNITEYPVLANVRIAYKQQLDAWIKDGWLIPYPDQKLRPPRGLIPLMAIIQQDKSKMQPVIDYHEFNQYI